MYFNNFYARTYFADDYWGVIGEDEEILLGAYKGLYLGLYAHIYSQD